MYCGRLVDVAAVQQSVEKVQPVGELMALGAQGRAHGLHGVEWRVRDSTSVRRARGEPCPDRCPRGHLARRHHDDPLADGGERRGRVGGPKTSSTRGVRPMSSTGVPGSFRVSSMMRATSLTNVTIPIGVDGQHAFVDPVQHRFLIAYQLGHSAGSRPQVRPRHRRASSTEPATPMSNARPTSKAAFEHPPTS